MLDTDLLAQCHATSTAPRHQPSAMPPRAQRHAAVHRATSSLWPLHCVAMLTAAAADPLRNCDRIGARLKGLWAVPVRDGVSYYQQLQLAAPALSSVRMSMYVYYCA